MANTVCLCLTKTAVRRCLPISSASFGRRKLLLRYQSNGAHSNGQKFSRDEAKAKVKTFIGTQRPEECIAVYDDICEDFDKVIGALSFTGDKKLGHHVTQILKDRFDAKILDAGAGTGIAGEMLHKLGYTDIDAVDASSGLLKVAEEKGCYKRVMCQFLGTDVKLPVEDDHYDMVVLCGAMGQGHVPVSAMDDLIRVVKSGGHIVNVFREEATRAPSYEGKFESYLEQLEKDGKWKQLIREEFPGFLEDVPGLVLVHKVI